MEKSIIQNALNYLSTFLSQVHFMMFKAWLRGIHHSVMHLQDYLDEYAYRFNRSFMKENIFDNLMARAVELSPVPRKTMQTA